MGAAKTTDDGYLISGQDNLKDLSGTVYFREELDHLPIKASFINFDRFRTVASRVYIPEKDTGRLNWSIKLPSGRYLVTFQIDGCQPISHGPYVI